MNKYHYYKVTFSGITFIANTLEEVGHMYYQLCFDFSNQGVNTWLKKYKGRIDVQHIVDFKKFREEILQF